MPAQDLPSLPAPTQVPAPADTNGGIDLNDLGGFRAETDFARCLLPLLTALRWQGDPRHLSEALPHFADTLDAAGFCNWS